MDCLPEAVFDLGPRVHRRGLRWKQRRYILWPAWAWRVVVPQAHVMALNPLQRVVLRLLAAGKRRYAEIGELLALPAELVAYIGQELVSYQAVNSEGVPTDRGERLLQDALVDVGALQLTWVYHDGLSGKLLPRLSAERRLANLEIDGDDRPRVVGGTKGAPYAHRAFLLQHQGRMPSPPTPTDVLNAAQGHRFQAKRWSRYSDLETIESPAAIDQVVRLTDEPEKVHLLTFVYVPEELEEDQLWYIADPFGLGASSELAQALKDHREQASEGVRDLLDRITGEYLTARVDELRVVNQLMEESARKKVDGDVPRRAALDDTRIREALVRAHVLLERGNLLGRALREQDETDAFLHIRKALEAGIDLVLQQHPPHILEALFTHEDGSTDGGQEPDELFRELILLSGQKSGFAKENIPWPIVKTRAGIIRYIVGGNTSGRLRGAVATLVLHAARVPDHPLRRIAQMDPIWLERLNSLADKAGRAIHLQNISDRSSETPISVQDDLKEAVDLLNTLLAALTNSKQETANHG